MPSPVRLARHLRPSRKRLNMAEQRQVLRLTEETKRTHADIGAEFGVSRQAVTKIKKRGALIDNEVTERAALGLPIETFTRRTITTCYTAAGVDRAMYRWLLVLADHGRDLNVTSDLIKVKAIEFARHLGMDTFQASNGWLAGFLKRYNVASLIRCGEAGAVAYTDDIAASVERIRQLLDNYSPDCIWNLDESALYYRTLSARSYVPRASLGATKRGGKKASKTSKERITFTLCVSAADVMLPIQVIGKSRSPRNFPQLPRTPLTEYNVHYYNTESTWQNNETCVSYVKKLNAWASDKGKSVVLLMDNASCHTKAAKQMDPNGTVSHLVWICTNTNTCYRWIGKAGIYRYECVTLVFLPPNTTSLHQPIDMGMVRSFKCSYRRHQLQYLLGAWESHQLVSPGAKFDLSSYSSMCFIRISR